MSGATHLHNRLDAADVHHIFALVESDNVSRLEICERYRISAASLGRILCRQDWSEKQVQHWGVPLIVKDERNKSPFVQPPADHCFPDPVEEIGTTQMANALANLISAQALVVEAFAECQDAGIGIQILEAILSASTPPTQSSFPLGKELF